jgi:hypothetical protein
LIDTPLSSIEQVALVPVLNLTHKLRQGSTKFPNIWKRQENSKRARMISFSKFYAENPKLLDKTTKKKTFVQRPGASEFCIIELRADT